MSTAYSGWSGGWKPSGSSVYKKYRAILQYSVTTTDDKVSVYAYVQLNINSPVTASYSGRLRATNGTTYTGSASTDFDKGTTTATIVGGHTYSWARATTAQTKYVYGDVSSTKGSWTGAWVTATATISVPALHSFPVEYDANEGTGETEPQTKFYSIPIELNESGFERSGWAFKEWNTADDGGGDTFLPLQEFTENAGREDVGTDDEKTTLYAIWQAMYPPSCDYTPLEDFEAYSAYTKNFSEIGTTLSNIEVHEGRELKNVVLTVGSDSTTKTLAELAQDDYMIWVTPSASGSQTVTLKLTDLIYEEGVWVDGAEKSYPLGSVDVQNPTWNITASFSTLFPDKDALGNSIITVYADWYDEGTAQGDYEEIPATYKATGEDNDWSIDVLLTERYVSSTTSTTPNAKIKVVYNHSDSEEKPYREAFFSTTRNANFSTGISNTVFVSGCDYTDYTSRVWWCYVNNPLYFPDTNYVEVGSNDTAVMGLMKVGDYLGAIKQSKTTDTAIYLIYPTSFEEDTTYAVKQGVQGIGALGKYTFNILGDETLFLSPRGVMAITPSQDDEHKVQNRSYFVDGKLLKEAELTAAYSFVYNGKYYLAVNDHCYVLDGNQRNSWGNDRTNLVYECYYLDNVPAECFAKYRDDLMFSNFLGLCRFKSETDEDAYIDAYNMTDEQENVPVKAKWATLFDDDGAVNYYKTMQKKGNAVSVLPNSPLRYTLVTITEEDFDAEKTKYFVRDGDNYIRCTEDSVYSAEIPYFILEKTGTKVYVRKDLNAPVEIQREFGESSEIPTELFINKKFKKYKRLQFILVNDADEPFGVDSIVKQYTVGNYAKR